MAVYVDHFPNRKSKKARWHFCSHMVADTEEELDVMAVKIGINTRHKQTSRITGIIHYDLTEGKRRIAIEHGSIPISTRDIIKKFGQRKDGEKCPKN